MKISEFLPSKAEYSKNKYHRIAPNQILRQMSKNNQKNGHYISFCFSAISTLNLIVYVDE